MTLYLAIAKWARVGHVPSFEDYMVIGSSSPGLQGLASYGYISMDDCDQKQLKEWFISKPKIFEALNIAFRIKNDIATFEVCMCIYITHVLSLTTKVITLCIYK